MTRMAPNLTLRRIEFAERPVRFRMPFRFGSAKVEGAPQVFVKAEIELDDGTRALGATAELMVPKWFNKDAALTPEQTVAQLRTALNVARDLYLSRAAFETAFARHAAHHRTQIARCADMGIPPLAACFGTAQLDKAILDALLRAQRLDVFSGVAGNVMGLDARLTPDLDDDAIADFLSSRAPAASVAIRHTVGMADPLEDLAGIHRTTGCRFFKLKLGGDPAADCDRLARIADALSGIDYRATLDANEQYASLPDLLELAGRLENDAALRPLAMRLDYIEQPMPRDVTWETTLGALGKRFAFIIDEAESDYDAFPKAIALGYRGISSKACKGIYKSLLNGARARRWTRLGSGAFVAAEDLTCQPGLALQQDTALVLLHGIAHAERNGHHYVNGFAETPQSEARAFLSAHPDLYEECGGVVRVAIRDGNISTVSLRQIGFASGVDPARVGTVGSSELQFKEEAQT
jgi:hypothetical protein